MLSLVALWYKSSMLRTVRLARFADLMYDAGPRFVSRCTPREINFEICRWNSPPDRDLVFIEGIRATGWENRSIEQVAEGKKEQRTFPFIFEEFLSSNDTPIFVNFTRQFYSSMIRVRQWAEHDRVEFILRWTQWTRRLLTTLIRQEETRRRTNDEIVLYLYLGKKLEFPLPQKESFTTIYV